MQEWKIHTDDSDQRLDRFLRKILPGKPLGEIFRMIRKKYIRVNGKKSSESYRLQEGDIVLLRGNLTSDDTKTTKMRPVATSVETDRIIWEDDHVLVYNKPAGLIVHPADHKTDEVSLIQMAQSYLQDSVSHTFRPALAHRIDRDTSGIILICKTKQSLMSLTAQFKSRKIQKTYLAFCHGIPENIEGSIEAPILRVDEEKVHKPKVVIHDDGDSASSKYRVVDTYEIEEKKYSLVEIHPKTGRMHQIRVHMAHIGIPLVGDKRYGGKRPPQALPSRISDIFSDDLVGHFLQASAISFEHPRSSQVVSFDL